MSHQTMLEGAIVLALAYVGIHFVNRLRHELQRVDRGIRLVTHFVDRAHERESSNTLRPH